MCQNAAAEPRRPSVAEVPIDGGCGSCLSVGGEGQPELFDRIVGLTEARLVESLSVLLVHAAGGGAVSGSEVGAHQGFNQAAVERHCLEQPVENLQPFLSAAEVQTQFGERLGDAAGWVLPTEG
jgi:hypothetical protein